MKITTHIALLAASVAMTACTTAAPAMEPTLRADLGEAVRQNANVMAVAPTDAERANTFIPFDRQRRAAAIQAYRDGTTPEPELMGTDE